MVMQRSRQRLSLAAVLLFAGVAAAGTGATVFAQQAGGPGGMQSASPNPAAQPTMPGQPGQPGQPGSNLPGSQPSASSYADQAFVRATLEDDASQVQLSQLAQQKSSSSDVKQFSQQMVKIHTELDTQLQPLAKQYDIKDPQKPSKKTKQELTKLQALSGPDFDMAYLQAMAKEQQHSLKEFTDEQKSAQNPALQKAAKDDEATLSRNFDVLQKLAAAHNVTIDDKPDAKTDHKK